MAGTAVPPCSRLGAQCRSLRVTLRVGSLEGDRSSMDHESTWLLGHTQHITFTDLWTGEGEVYADAVLHVPCKHLDVTGGAATCRAHGFSGPAPRPSRPRTQPRRLGGDRFQVVDGLRLQSRTLRSPPPAPRAARALPVLDGANPCAVAVCRTGDQKIGAACCRDLQVEIMCTREQTRLESLVRSRRSPYLCKVNRPGDYSIEAEIISACDYLEPGGVNCTLHGRVRADGRPAKPEMCSDWPPKRLTLHPGCVFAGRAQRTRDRARERARRERWALAR
jgi:hypothetical protein